MLKNHNHDLVQQLSEASDSLWRMEEYIKNSEGCDNCQSMWKSMKEDLERHVDAIKLEIERHMNEKRFD